MSAFLSFADLHKESMDILGTQIPRKDTEDPVLPVELFHQVLDNCDGPTLITCFSVNHVLRENAERRLFRTVVIQYFSFNRNASRYQKFLMLLEAAPHLADYVRRISIDVIGASSTREADLSTNTGILSVAKILPLLRNIQHIALVGKGEISVFSRLPNLEWTALPIAVQEAFIRAFLSSSISKIQVSAISEFPYSVLSKCTSLKNLYLSAMDSTVEPRSLPHDDLTSVLGTPSHHRPKLDTLTIRGWYESIERRFLSPECPVDISHLRKLSFWGEGSIHQEEVAHLLRVYGTSIEQLEFTMSTRVQTTYNTVNVNIMPRPPPVFPISLNNLHNLSTLTIKTRISLAYTPLEEFGYRSPLPWIASLLMTLPSSNILTELSIHLKFSMDELNVNQIDWEVLASALVSDRLSSLRSVRLVVSTHSPPFSSKWMKMLKDNEHLSKLICKGFLRILVADRFCAKDG
ncbi:hypothetical protein B0H34DRAFT_681781 [Crassisporium funariophilum]|nr:hypothetical protein B0H34DRAFT_681781 [Crassisporium funariophilum]